MAKIDKLLATMVQHQAERASLAGGKSCSIFIAGKKSDGGVLSTDALQEIIAEITPGSLRARLQENTSFQMKYDSPHGAFEIRVDHLLGALQVDIVPVGNNVSSPRAIANTVATVPARDASRGGRIIAEAKGVDGHLELYEDRLTIKRKQRSGAFKSELKGEKEILLTSISSLQFNLPSGKLIGSIRFVVSTGTKDKGSSMQAAQEQHSVTFSKGQIRVFESFKSSLDKQRAVANHPPSAPRR